MSYVRDGVLLHCSTEFLQVFEQIEERSPIHVLHDQNELTSAKIGVLERDGEIAAVHECGTDLGGNDVESVAFVFDLEDFDGVTFLLG